MSRTDERRDAVLPVTNEIGSEGGTYGDATLQVDTFEAPAKDARTPGVGGPGSAANYAIRGEDIIERRAPGDAGSGMVRYPTEPPPRHERDSAARNWAPGLVGAAAGLAIGLLAARRR